MTKFNFDLTQAAITRTKILTLSGALPFLGALVLVLFPVAPFDAAHIASTYAALIIAFLGGTQWGLFLVFSQKSPINLMVQSNLVTLVAWTGLLVLPVAGAVALHALCFLYLLLLDYRLFTSGILPLWYFSLRRLVTLIVISLLLAMIAALFY
jgi:hypothetical protein